LALAGWLVTYRNKCPAPGIKPGHPTSTLSLHKEERSCYRPTPRSRVPGGTQPAFPVNPTLGCSAKISRVQQGQASRPRLAVFYGVKSPCVERITTKMKQSANWRLVDCDVTQLLQPASFIDSPLSPTLRRVASGAMCRVPDC